MRLKTWAPSRTSAVPRVSSRRGAPGPRLSELPSALAAFTRRRTGCESQRAPTQAAAPMMSSRTP